MHSRIRAAAYAVCPFLKAVLAFTVGGATNMTVTGLNLKAQNETSVMDVRDRSLKLSDYEGLLEHMKALFVQQQITSTLVFAIAAHPESRFHALAL